jgi:hypothetical protein
MKMADEIIKELWKIKDSIANKYGYDVKALVAHLRAKEHRGEEPVVNLRYIKQTAEQTSTADAKSRDLS